jgi:hypothetical protein
MSRATAIPERKYTLYEFENIWDFTYRIFISSFNWENVECPYLLQKKKSLNPHIYTQKSQNYK